MARSQGHFDYLSAGLIPALNYTCGHGDDTGNGIGTGRGGARPGAGRPKGSRNRTTLERVMGKEIRLEVLSRGRVDACWLAINAPRAVARFWWQDCS